jgi:cytochrome P450
MSRRLPPGPSRLPVVGSLMPYVRDQPRFLMENYRRYGPVIRFDFLTLRGAILCGAAANRYILVDAVDNFRVAPIIDNAHARWIVGEGLLFIDEPAHGQQRRLIMPSMHKARLEQYHQAMREITAQALERWQPGAEFDLSEAMDDLALLIAGRTLFNIDLNGAARQLADSVRVVLETMNDIFRIAFAQLPFDVPGLGYGGSLRRAIARSNTIVEEIIACHERDGADAGDVVSMLLAARDEENGARLSADQVRDHLLTLMVAGHETIANALAWSCYLLAQHPHVAAKLLGELERELRGQPPALADLDRLQYLEQVVKEALRIYPPATSLFRTARAAFEWQGFELPAGATIMYTPYVSHRIPEHFPAPEQFQPERFDPSSSTPPSYAYIPFGGGPRSCVGAPFAMLELKTVLAMIVQRYRLDLAPHQQVVATVRTTLQPKYGIRMRPYPQDGRVERSAARVLGNVVGATPGPI